MEAALRAKDLGPALRWCEDNASRLRKLESTLEFRVREKAFLEMVRENKKEEVTFFLCFSLIRMRLSFSFEHTCGKIKCCLLLVGFRSVGELCRGGFYKEAVLRDVRPDRGDRVQVL